MIYQLATWIGLRIFKLRHHLIAKGSSLFNVNLNVTSYRKLSLTSDLVIFSIVLHHCFALSLSAHIRCLIKSLYSCLIIEHLNYKNNIWFLYDLIYIFYLHVWNEKIIHEYKPVLLYTFITTAYMTYKEFQFHDNTLKVVFLLSKIRLFTQQ